MSFGYFDPLFGKRIMKRLSRENVRFAAPDASGVGMGGAEVRYARRSPLPYPMLCHLSRIELFVHAADTGKARTVIDGL